MRLSAEQVDMICTIIREALETNAGGPEETCQNQECLDTRSEIEGMAIVVAKALERLTGIDYSDATSAADAAQESAADASTAVDGIESEIDEVGAQLTKVEGVLDRLLRS